jgi:hypothetical protein
MTAPDRRFTVLPECPRCGGVHKGLTAYRLIRPIRPVGAASALPFVAWMPCPVTAEPILLTEKVPFAEWPDDLGSGVPILFSSTTAGAAAPTSTANPPDADTGSRGVR